MLNNRSKLPVYKRIGILFAISIAAIAVTPAGVLAQPERVSKSFAEIAKKVEPAVVSIDTKSKTPQIAARGSVSPNGDDGDIVDFLRKQMQQRPVHAVGSGFIVEKSGYIVTNAHVIEDAARITVKIDSGEEFYARVVGLDYETDIAVLKIDVRRDLPFVKFGDSDKAEVGDWVLAIGSPFGLTKTVTAGIISQKQRETPQATLFQKFIQTDAAINRGNSGGPLVNLDGEVIGVNSQIATLTGDYSGIGFALPSRVTENVYGQIVKTGKVRRGYLGALLDSVKAEFASVYGLKEAKGAIVTGISDRQSPAALAGVQVGDIIVTFNGQPVESAQDLVAKIASTVPDQSVQVGIMRENGANVDAKTISIRLRERPPRRSDDDNNDRRVLGVADTKADKKPFGLTLGEMSPILVEKYKLGDQKGLVVKEIDQTSFISDVKDARGGDALAEGDLIQRINRITVTDLKTFNEIASKLKAGDPVVLHVLAVNSRSGNLELKVVQFTVK